MKVQGWSTRRKERRHASIAGEAFYFIAGKHVTENVLIIDVTPQGAGVLISRRLQTGQMVKLRFPMPRELRAYDHRALDYEVWGIVRYAIKNNGPDSGAGSYEIGIAFSGREAPPEYLSNPETLFDLKPVPKRDGLWSLRLLSRGSNWNG